MIKIEVDDLKTDLERLQGAIKDFEPYSQDFIRNTVDRFEGFNSDFISKIKDTLNNMTDTKAPELLKKVQSFHDVALSVVEELENLDLGIAEKINSNKKEG